MLQVTVLSPTSILFQGQVKSVILPGEQGVFEVLPFHKRMASRLLQGNISIDGQLFSIRRGIMKVEKNEVSIVIEPN